MKLKLTFFAATALVCGVFAAEKQPDTPFGTAFQSIAGEDQASFVRTVNKSQVDSDEPMDAKRIETVYRINRDAVKAAPEADRKTVLAEVFATAPLDCLPRITEGFASELFNRKAAGFSEKDGDDAFVEFAVTALMRIKARCVRLNMRPGARTAFAIIMFIKASEGKPKDLRNEFLMFIPTGSHELARTVWIPAAMGDDGKPPSYTELLDADRKGEEPNHVNEHPMSPVELGPLQLGSDLRVGNSFDIKGPTPVDYQRIPRDIGTKGSPWYTRHRGDKPREPAGQPYLGQFL